MKMPMQFFEDSLQKCKQAKKKKSVILNLLLGSSEKQKRNSEITQNPLRLFLFTFRPLQIL